MIERLNDQDADVRQAARRVLVRLARHGFRTARGVSKRMRLKAQQRWLDWLALQDDKSEQTALKPGLLALRPEGRLTAVDDDVARCAAELLTASGTRREELLHEWRDSKGGAYTDTLAYAIPQLSEPMQAKARQALAERLTRMTAATLRAMLRDDDAEVRRAATLACGAKKARAHIPDVLPLLEDEEPIVADAARVALKTLSGKDFGPRQDAGRAERSVAMAAWKAWWTKRGKEGPLSIFETVSGGRKPPVSQQQGAYAPRSPMSGGCSLVGSYLFRSTSVVITHTGSLSGSWLMRRCRHASASCSVVNRSWGFSASKRMEAPWTIIA